MYLTIYDADCSYIFRYNRYANDIVFNISNMKHFFKWFVQNFVLFHCSRGEKKKLDFSIIY